MKGGRNYLLILYLYLYDLTFSVGESSYSVRLTGGHDPSEGRVEIFMDGEWGTVCDDLWTIHEAYVVCRQLGFKYAHHALIFSYFGEGDGEIKLDDVECTGLEDSLIQCKHPGVGLHNCQSSEQAGVRCSNRTETRVGKIYQHIFSKNNNLKQNMTRKNMC